VTTTTPPPPSGTAGNPSAPTGSQKKIAHGWYSDARMAENVAREVFAGSFIYVRGIGWLRWTGKNWKECGDGPPIEAVRGHVVSRIRHWGGRIGLDIDADDRLEQWKKLASRNRIESITKLASRNRIESITKLARGLVEKDISSLDAHPDLLNTPAGIVDLPTGKVTRHDPDKLLVRITRGNYRRGYTHPDVEMLRQALPAGSEDWYWAFMGKGITGHHHDVVLIQRGDGNNGKGALVNAGIRRALGDYGVVASPAIFAAGRAQGHATSITELRGARIVLGEELNEGMSLDITAISASPTWRRSRLGGCTRTRSSSRPRMC
jgi:putative DNA primase/helicase